MLRRYGAADGPRHARIHLGWGSGIPKGWRSATAFCLDQANKKPWTDELNKPRLGWTEMQQANQKLRESIVEFAKSKVSPFTTREAIDWASSDKSRVNSAITRLEREKILGRVNLNGRLHWMLK